MKVNVYFKQMVLGFFVFSSIQLPTSLAFAKGTGSKKQVQNNNRANASASIATNTMVANLNIANNNNEEDGETIKYLDSQFDLINKNKDQSFQIFSTSVNFIKQIFESDQLSSDQNILTTIKQTACILVAETHYGDPKLHGDICDKANIAQIRPPAYEEVYKYCRENLTLKYLDKVDQGLTCDTFHPYELPPCEGVNTTDMLGDKMPASMKIKKPQSNGAYHWKYPQISCIDQTKFDFLESANIPTWPQECRDTSGDLYSRPRIPASPKHSIFTGLLYLKIMGYRQMSDTDFVNFGAENYNRSSVSEKAGYRRKLSTCLKELDKYEKSKVIKEAFDRTTAPPEVQEQTKPLLARPTPSREQKNKPPIPPSLALTLKSLEQSAKDLEETMAKYKRHREKNTSLPARASSGQR